MRPDPASLPFRTCDVVLLPGGWCRKGEPPGRGDIGSCRRRAGELADSPGRPAGGGRSAAAAGELSRCRRDFHGRWRLGRDTSGRVQRRGADELAPVERKACACLCEGRGVRPSIVRAAGQRELTGANQTHLWYLRRRRRVKVL